MIRANRIGYQLEIGGPGRCEVPRDTMPGIVLARNVKGHHESKKKSAEKKRWREVLRGTDTQRQLDSTASDPACQHFHDVN